MVYGVELSIAWCKAKVAGTKVAPGGVGACRIEKALIKALINICGVENGHEAEWATKPPKIMLRLPKQRVIAKTWHPNQELHFPEPSASSWDHVTSFHLWEHDTCHFWAKVVKKWVCLFSLSPPLAGTRNSNALRDRRTKRYKETGHLYHLVEESCPLAKYIHIGFI